VGIALYYFVILALLVGFTIGWILKKKKIEELPTGIKEFQVEDWYRLEPLFRKVVERTEEAVKAQAEGKIDDVWLDSQWTLPEIRTLLYCGLEDGKLKENIDKLNSETAFQLYLKIMEVRNNRHFFTRAATVKLKGNTL
jgi:hypothetical protein